MTSRRQMLKSSLALAAGAVGFGAARKAIGGSGGADPPPAPTSSSARMPKSLSLTGRNVHAVSNGRPMGHGPDAGERTALSGELVDANGAALGNFYVSSTAFGSPLDGPAPVVESHTFRLPDGTIHGMGTADDAFAIVGGTGRYLGARGSYTATHMPIELGGDGSAAFRMTFTK